MHPIASRPQPGPGATLQVNDWGISAGLVMDGRLTVSAKNKDQINWSRRNRQDFAAATGWANRTEVT